MENIKTRNRVFTALAFALTVVMMLVITMTSADAFVDKALDYSEKMEKIKIVDNVVYELYDYDDEQPPYYCVIEFGATKKIRQTMTEINIVDNIDGIPVKRITRRDNLGNTEYPNAKKLTISDSVISVDYCGFSGLINVEKVKLSKNLEELEDYAFSEMAKLEEITLPKGIDRIRYGLFYNCKNLKKVIIKGEIKHIDNFAFARCESLSNIAPLKSLGYIGICAFEFCKNLKSIDLPSTVSQIAGRAFYKSGLTSVKIPARTELVRCDGSLEDYIGFKGAQFQGCKNLKTVTFENRKKSMLIPVDCFADCSNLKTVKLPKGSEGISLLERAFYNCSALKSVENSGKITGVRSSAFRNCKSLTSIAFSSKIKYIETRAFKNCKSLTSITFKSKDKLPVNSHASREVGTKFDKDTFSGTPNGIKFFIKNTSVAKKLNKSLKGSGVKNAQIYRESDGKLLYKNVK